MSQAVVRYLQKLGLGFPSKCIMASPFCPISIKIDGGSNLDVEQNLFIGLLIFRPICTILVIIVQFWPEIAVNCAIMAQIRENRPKYKKLKKEVLNQVYLWVRKYTSGSESIPLGLEVYLRVRKCSFGSGSVPLGRCSGKSKQQLHPH